MKLMKITKNQIRVKQIYIIGVQDRKDAEEDMNVAIKLIKQKDIIDFNIFHVLESDQYWGYIKYLKKIRVS